MPISLKTTNISESFIVHILVDFNTIEAFINKNFVKKYYLNTYKLFKIMPVYNVNRIFNKAGQISKVVNVVLYYQIHVKQMLLIVSSLEKQDLILRFIKLKQYNLEMNWIKREVFMTHCSTHCLGCQEVRKTKKLRIYTLDMDHSGSVPTLTNDLSLPSGTTLLS